MEGILLVNKPAGATSFSLIRALRKKTGVKKIGHAGTLDPFATGVMILLVGRNYTKQSDQFLKDSKSYRATTQLGFATTTYDTEGDVTETSSHIPSHEEVNNIISQFQGTLQQVPPMFSAKKVNGKKLYDLARKGIEIERAPCTVHVELTNITYDYPTLTFTVHCSKGTYIRSLAHDIGKALTTYGHLTSLERLSSGSFTLEECIEGKDLFDENFDVTPHIKMRTIP